MHRLLIFLAILIVFFAVGQKTRFLPEINLDKYLNLPKISPPVLPNGAEKRVLLYEDSVITKVVEEALPSVVTIGINTTSARGDSFEFDPFNPFSPFRPVPGNRRNIERNIGSGFIISNDGLIITNKHVVSDTNAKYTVLTNDSKKYDVVSIYRDPVNDASILKINASGLKPLVLGNSSTLKLGQLVIAIGTPLGEFTNTVTSGIISGLGRGITAGSPFEGAVEKLDNVIQTDAAISPGNSGGPLLNSRGEVIGINTAIAAEGQNIGFAIPSNVIKELIDNFEKRGSTFERPYLGVRYRLLDRQTAVLNDLVEGAYVVEVLQDSPAAKAGVQEEDIITEIDEQKIRGDDQGLAKIISEKKIGDSVLIKIWRDNQMRDFRLTLESANQ